MFDNPRVRGLFASLSDGWTYVNAQSRPQVPEKVSAAVSRSFRVSNLLEPVEARFGSHSRSEFPGRRIGESFESAARVAIADLVGGRAEYVVLGSSRAALLDRLANTMSHKLSIGQDIVLSRVDDPANLTPWQEASRLYGATVKWAEPDLSTGALPAWQYADLVGPDTSVVALGAANRHVGAVNDVRAVTDIVRTKAPKAMTVVDVDNIAPHRVVDMWSLGADVVAVDMSSLGGPHIGALIFQSDEVMSRVVTNTRRSLRSTLEFGGVAEGLLGGVPATVDHLAMLDEDVHGTRRRRLETALPQASDYVNGLARRAVEGLQSLGTVHVIGIDGDFDADPHFDNIDRIPRVTFMVDGVPAHIAQQRLIANRVVADVVRPNESELLRAMGVFGDPEDANQGRRSRRAKVSRHREPQSSYADSEEPYSDAGAVTLSFAVHNTLYDVDQVVRAVASLA